MSRFLELLESRRFLSVSPTIQSDLSEVRGAIASLLADVKRIDKLTKPDVRRLKTDFRHAGQSQKQLLNVFNSDLNRAIGDLNGSLGFLRHVAGHDLPLATSAVNSLSRNPGNATGESMLSSAVSWLTTDSQTGGLLAEGLRLTDKASGDLSTVATSLPTNAPAQRDVAKAQTDVTSIDAALHLDTASFASSMQKLIADLQS
jgi:hypothetical protein